MPDGRSAAEARPSARLGFIAPTLLAALAIAALVVAGVVERRAEESETRKLTELIDRVGFHRTLALDLKTIVAVAAPDAARPDHAAAAGSLAATQEALRSANARALELVRSSAFLRRTGVEADLVRLEEVAAAIALAAERILDEEASAENFREIAVRVSHAIDLATEVNRRLSDSLGPTAHAGEHFLQDVLSWGIVAVVAAHLAFVVLPLRRRLRAEAARLSALSQEVWTLSTIARRTTNAVVVTDLDGRVTWVNEGFERLTGYGLEEARGRKPGSFLQCEETDPATVAEIGRALAERRPIRCELLNRAKDGRVYWLDIEIQPLLDEAGRHRGFVAIETDISEAKALAAEVARRNADLEMMSRLAKIGVWSVEGPERRLYWSPEVRRLHGVGPDFEPSVETASAFYPEPDRSRLLAALARCVGDGEDFEGEMPFVALGGERRVVRVLATRVVDRGGVKLLGAFQDVTEAAQTREEERVAKQRLELATESAGVGLWDWTLREDRVWTSPTWWTHLGFAEPRAAAPIAVADAAIHPDDLGRVRAERAAFFAEPQGGLHVEYRHAAAGGGWRWVVSTGRVTGRGADGRPTRVSGVFIDIHDRKIATEQAAYAARHDLLTGLANRAELKRLIRESLVGGEPFCVLVLDLDRFKAINDTFGHVAGDAVLMGVARRLAGIVRERDVVARLGGDEFAILLRQGRDPREACAGVAARILEAIAEPFDVGGREVQIGVSIGVAIGPEHGEDPDSLVRNADAALYKVKAQGKNAARVFDDELAAEAQQRRELEGDLRAALANGELSLEYQMEVELATGAPTAAEALLRWRHPERGLVRPDVFVPIAEETGLIVPIGEWVIERACRDAAAWPEEISVAINLSPAQIGRTDLLAVVGRALLQSGLPPRRLELEITESVFLAGDEAMLRELRALADLGVRLALDDFGTGYSSLGYLHKLPFGKIKIDKTFVADLARNRHSAAIVAAVTNLARSLGIDTTAEGVETEEQAALLRAAGCTLGQGWRFARPVPTERLFEPRGEALRRRA